MSLIASVGLVFGLTATILLRKEDVRDRFLRLLGIGQITQSTPMLDEASRAIGKYLFWQTLLNLTFGVIFGLELFVVGIPYAVDGMTWSASAKTNQPRVLPCRPRDSSRAIPDATPRPPERHRR